jgi:hypothetical protein
MPLSALLDVAGLGRRVEQQLMCFMLSRLSTSQPGSVDHSLAQPIVDLVLARGKRLRAAFCYWGWRGAGGADCNGALAAAAALELLHAFALIHDDVMDASTLRRGLGARVACRAQVAVRRDDHAALAMDRLDQHGRGPVVDRCAQGIGVAVRDPDEPGRERAEVGGGVFSAVSTASAPVFIGTTRIPLNLSSHRIASSRRTCRYGHAAANGADEEVELTEHDGGRQSSSPCRHLARTAHRHLLRLGTCGGSARPRRHRIPGASGQSDRRRSARGSRRRSCSRATEQARSEARRAASSGQRLTQRDSPSEAGASPGRSWRSSSWSSRES